MKKLLLLGVLISLIACQSKESVDSIIINANIYTVNNNFEKAEAFAIKDGKFVVGDEGIHGRYAPPIIAHRRRIRRVGQGAHITGDGHIGHGYNTAAAIGNGRSTLRLIQGKRHILQPQRPLVVQPTAITTGLVIHKQHPLQPRRPKI